MQILENVNKKQIYGYILLMFQYLVGLLWRAITSLRTEYDLEGFFFKNDQNILIFWSLYHLDRRIRLRKKSQKRDLTTLLWAIFRQNTPKIARFKKNRSP